MASGARRCSGVAPCAPSAFAPDSLAKACAAIHIASGGAVALKRKRRNAYSREEASRREMTRLSNVTASVPAAGPNRTAAVIVKLSEIEKLASPVGRRKVAAPPSTVSARGTSHGAPTGASASCHSEEPIAHTPRLMTANRYTPWSHLGSAVREAPGAESDAA